MNKKIKFFLVNVLAFILSIMPVSAVNPASVHTVREAITGIVVVGGMILAVVL